VFSLSASRFSVCFAIYFYRRGKKSFAESAKVFFVEIFRFLCFSLSDLRFVFFNAEEKEFCEERKDILG